MRPSHWDPSTASAARASASKVADFTAFDHAGSCAHCGFCLFQASPQGQAFLDASQQQACSPLDAADATAEACEGWCDQRSMREHCLHCSCQGCGWCPDTFKGQHIEPPPPSPGPPGQLQQWGGWWASEVEHEDDEDEGGMPLPPVSIALEVEPGSVGTGAQAVREAGGETAKEAAKEAATRAARVAALARSFEMPPPPVATIAGATPTASAATTTITSSSSLSSLSSLSSSTSSASTSSTSTSRDAALNAGWLPVLVPVLATPSTTAQIAQHSTSAAAPSTTAAPSTSTSATPAAAAAKQQPFSLGILGVVLGHEGAADLSLLGIDPAHALAILAAPLPGYNTCTCILHTAHEIGR